jgi:hypothetical protein
MTQAGPGNDDRASNVVVKDLMEDYIGEGHTLVTDNFYNLDFTHYLLDNKTHLEETWRQKLNDIPRNVL